MRELTIEESRQAIEELCEKSIKRGMEALEELGSKLVEKAHEYEEKGVKTPMNLLTISTPFYSVQLNYLGKELGGDFVLLDTRDKYTKKPHGYSKTYFGNPQAFLLEIIRELNWIDYLHERRAEE